MSQNYFYPPSGGGGSSSNLSVAPNGGPVAPDSTLIAGTNAGLQTPVSVDSSGNVNTNIVSAPPVTGTVTANQGTPNAGGASAWPVNVQASVLPTGASTSANQTTATTALNAFAAKTMSGLVTTPYDYISITYLTVSGTEYISTVRYYTGGSGGTLQATLTITYDGANNIQTITKT